MKRKKFTKNIPNQSQLFTTKAGYIELSKDSLIAIAYESRRILLVKTEGLHLKTLVRQLMANPKSDVRVSYWSARYYKHTHLKGQFSFKLIWNCSNFKFRSARIDDSVNFNDCLIGLSECKSDVLLILDNCHKLTSAQMELLIYCLSRLNRKFGIVIRSTHEHLNGLKDESENKLVTMQEFIDIFVDINMGIEYSKCEELFFKPP